MNAEQKKVQDLMTLAVEALSTGQSDFECYEDFLTDVLGVECSMTLYIYAEQDSTAMIEVSMAFKPDGATGNLCKVTRSSHKPYTDEVDEAKPWEPWREYQKLKVECARLLLADDNELFRVAVARAAIDAAAGLGASSGDGCKRL